MSLTDQRFLASFDRKLQVIRDYTTGVATGRATGLYVFGPGGCGKTHTIVRELDRLACPYRVFNSRMTGRGLYNTLAAFPDEIHVLEDMEQIFRDAGARGVLRSALWGQPSAEHGGRPERVVTWTTYRMTHEFIFTGGLIMTGNRPFPDIPELQAIRTRISCQQLTVADQEMMAMMRDICHRGHRRGCDVMEPEECIQVCEHIFGESRGLNRSFDLRLLINSFGDYIQWRECESGLDWRDLVASRVKERPTCIREAMPIAGRIAQKERELELAREIASQTDDRQERFRLWREQTGKSEKTLYRRLQSSPILDVRN